MFSDLKQMYRRQTMTRHLWPKHLFCKSGWTGLFLNRISCHFGSSPDTRCIIFPGLRRACAASSTVLCWAPSPQHHEWGNPVNNKKIDKQIKKKKQSSIWLIKFTCQWSAKIESTHASIHYCYSTWTNSPLPNISTFIYAQTQQFSFPAFYFSCAGQL